MADIQKMESALRNAHQAGDTEAARKLARALKAVRAESPEYSGTILPFSKMRDGSVEFDSNAGLAGMAKRAFSLPGDVMKGDVPIRDENGNISNEVIGRSAEMAMVASPMNPMVRSGDRVIPGVARSIGKNVPRPSMEALKDTGAAGFQRMAEMNVDYSPRAVQNLAVRLHSDLAKKGYTPETAKQTYRVLKQLTKIPAAADGERVSAPLQSLNAARSTFGNIATGRAGKPDGAAAEIVRRAISDFIEAGDPRTVMAGPAAAVARISKEARGNYAAAKRSAALQGVDLKATRRAASTNSGQNIGNTVRQRLASFLENPKAQRGFSPEELEDVVGIVNGTKAQNALRDLGNLFGGGQGMAGMLASGGAGGAGYAITGDPMTGVAAGAGIYAAGKGMKAYYNRLVLRALRAADEAVRSRSPLYEEMLRQAKPVAQNTVRRSIPPRAGIMTAGSGGGY